MAALGYDSAMILADAIKRAGTTESEGFARRHRGDEGLPGHHRQNHAG